MQENPNTSDAAVGGNPDPATQRKPRSEAQVRASRENGKKSKGPTTEAGKARASQNAFQHGAYAKRVYPTKELWVKDGADYQAIARGLTEHYAPVGYMEHLLVERIATGLLRSARIVGHEQLVFGSTVPFETRSAGTLPRYQTAIERQLAKDVAWLERLQAERKANAVSTSSPDNDPVTTGEVSDPQQPEGAIVIDVEPTPGSGSTLGAPAQ